MAVLNVAVRPAEFVRTGRRLPAARWSGRLSLAGQFMLASFVVLVIGMLVIGTWLAQAIEHGALTRSASITAVYVNSVLSDYLEGLDDEVSLDPEIMATFDHLLADTALGERVVAFKVWSPRGEVLYSPDRRLMGQHFDVDGGLERALDGELSADVSDLHEDENAYERQRWNRLLEVYAPVRERSAGRILAVIEFYQTPDELEHEIGVAQRQSWGVVAAVLLGVYALLAGIVKRGSDTIARQQDVLLGQEAALRQRVVELSDLLQQNARLHERVREAALVDALRDLEAEPRGLRWAGGR
jgi:hypothetical protein